MTYGVALVTLGNITSPLVALVTAPLLAQALGATGRGEAAAATAPLMLAAAAFTLGLPDAVAHYTAKQNGLSQKTLLLIVALVFSAGVFAAIAIWAAAPLLSGDTPAVITLMRLSGLTVPFSLVAGLVRGVARGHRRWNLVALEQLLGALFKLTAIVWLYKTHALVPSTAVVVLAVSTFVGIAAYIPLLRRSSLHRGSATTSVGTVIKYGAAVWIGSMAGIALSRIDQMLILPLSTAAALGVYAVSVSLADVIRVFNSAVRDVVFSEQSANLQFQKLAIATRVSTVMTLLAGIGLIATASLLVVPLFGQDFEEVPAVLAILVSGIVIGNSASVLAAGLSAMGKPFLRSAAISTGLVANVLLVLSLVPGHGAKGAAAASAIANTVTAVAVFLLARREFGITASEFFGLRKSDLSVVRKTLSKRLGK